MEFLTLDIIKKHLNIDVDFTDDDNLLEVYGNAAEQAIARHLDVADIHDLCENGELAEPVKVGMLLMCGNLYANRESIAPVTMVKVPETIDMLLKTYIDYSPLTKRCECC